MLIPLLEAIELSKHYTVPSGAFGRRATLRAVDDVTLSVYRGETMGLVGESGCGKSTLGRSLLNLHAITAGEVRFEGRAISNLRERDMRALRPRMQMVFQDPYGSLNPRRRVADLIAEPLRVHRRTSSKWRTDGDITERVRNLVDIVGLRADHLQRYPHEFSGGQRQRIGIARALALEPSLIVADEPVSALDVSIQAQIVNLLMDLQARFQLTYVFVAHDLAVVRQIATRTAVMYLGGIVETGPTLAVFAAPAHPYTAALLAAVPRAHAGGRPHAVPAGEIPSPIAPPPGCRFHPRCPQAQARCREVRPLLQPVGDGRQVACHFPLV